jgi:hypothetical protein
MRVGETRYIGSSLQSVHPLLQSLRGTVPERHRPFLAAFAVQTDARSRTEDRITDLQCGGRRDVGTHRAHLRPAMPHEVGTRVWMSALSVSVGSALSAPSSLTTQMAVLEAFDAIAEAPIEYECCHISYP